MLQLLIFSVLLSVLSDSSKRWQEKADLLTRLESQVKRMKDNFDSKESLLLEERDKATEAHKYATVSEESKSLPSVILGLLIHAHPCLSDPAYTPKIYLYICIQM